VKAFAQDQQPGRHLTRNRRVPQASRPGRQRQGQRSEQVLHLVAAGAQACTAETQQRMQLRVIEQDITAFAVAKAARGQCVLDPIDRLLDLEGTGWMVPEHILGESAGADGDHHVGREATAQGRGLVADVHRTRLAGGNGHRGSRGSPMRRTIASITRASMPWASPGNRSRVDRAPSARKWRSASTASDTDITRS